MKGGYIKMVTKIRSISISEDLAHFLDENPYLSLSTICQDAIRQQIRYSQQDATTSENRSLKQRLEQMREQLMKRVEFIEKKGLMDEFLKENGF